MAWKERTTEKRGNEQNETAINMKKDIQDSNYLWSKSRRLINILHNYSMIPISFLPNT